MYRKITIIYSKTIQKTSLLRKLVHNVLPNYSNPKHFTILKFLRTLCTRIIFESTESLAAAQFHLDAYCTFRKSTFMHEQWTWALKKILVLNIFLLFFFFHLHSFADRKRFLKHFLFVFVQNSKRLGYF